MGRRRKEAAQMGKALIKDRFRGKKTDRGGESFLHTTEMNDGSEWGTLNLQSVTEQTSLDDFLTTAELAGRDFTAEKENVTIITNTGGSQPMSKERLQKIKAAQNLYKDMLRIPRRPPWTEKTTADKLREDEHISFLEWRRQLGRLQEEEHIVITPYEKNLEFWRQLWRVIERSDVVVQIVDARNPLLFWCPDLDLYVNEVDPQKQTLLLINKADYLTLPQRQAWADYFTSQGVRVIFWSAKEETARLQEENLQQEKNDEEPQQQDDETSDEDVDEDDENNTRKSEDGTKRTEVLDKDKNSTTDSNKSNELKTNATQEAEQEQSSSRNEKVETSQNVTDSANSSGNSKQDTTEVTVEVNENNDENTVDDDDNENGNEDEDNDDDDDNENGNEDDDSDGFETEEEYTDDEAEPGEVKIIEDKSDEKKSLKTPKGTPRNASVTRRALDVPNNTALQSSEELLQLFRQTAQTHFTVGVTTVGMVGYPNVGKSSSINAILRTKKVPVSATPGRTKHFQTLYVEKDLMLCDCPGLVFPSFVNSKAELVVNGILPIDQLQDCDPPVTLVCERIGREGFEGTYNINLPPPEEWEPPNSPPSAYDVLHAYGLLRGFMSHKGNPDRPRAARYILKDFVNGKLLFCHPPPGIDALAFQKPPYAEPRVYKVQSKAVTKKTKSEIKTEAIDQEFFEKNRVRAHALGPRGVTNYVRTEAFRSVGASQGEASGASTPYGSQASLVGKPWKKHNNRNKKEKLRRVYAEHDRY